MTNSDLVVTIEMRFNMVLALRMACEVARQTTSSEEYQRAIAKADTSGITLKSTQDLAEILPGIIEELHQLIKEGFQEINRSNKVDEMDKRFNA